MSHVRRQVHSLVIIVLPLVLVSCGKRELLQPSPATNPAAVRFAGNWQLRDDPQQIERAISRAIRETADMRDDVIPDQRSGRQGSRRQRARGGLAHVFFKNGENLKITQTPSALFVSFNRAIVEEYRFGELREIRTGQAEAMRASGWDGRDYVIETLDQQGMKLTERYRLSSDRRTLERHIAFRSKNNETESVLQTFARLE